MRINIYKNRGEWCYAAFNGNAFDHSDTIDVSDSASESEARTAIARQFPGAQITRVPDTNQYSRVGLEAARSWLKGRGYL